MVLCTSQVLSRTPILIIKYSQHSAGQVQSTGFRDGGFGFEYRYQKNLLCLKKISKINETQISTAVHLKWSDFSGMTYLQTPLSLCVFSWQIPSVGVRDIQIQPPSLVFLVFILFWFFMYAQPFAFHFLLRPTKEMGLSSYTHNICLSVILV